MPEAVMRVYRQLAVPDHRRQDLPLEVQVIARAEILHGGCRVEDHEAAVDVPRERVRFLVETHDGIAVHLQLPEPATRPDAREHGGLPRAPVLREKLRDIHVADAVTVGQTEPLRVLEVTTRMPDPCAGFRLLPRVREGDAPVRFLRGPVELNLRVTAQGHGDVGDHGLVLEKELLDRPPLEAQAQHEILDAVHGIQLHDMPQDGPTADGQHRLGHDLGDVSYPAALPPA